LDPARNQFLTFSSILKEKNKTVLVTKVAMINLLFIKFDFDI